MSTFFDLYMAGKATIEDLETHFEKWHTSRSSLPIYQYLGITREQYHLWCDSPAKLKRKLDRIKRSRDKSTRNRVAEALLNIAAELVAEEENSENG